MARVEIGLCKSCRHHSSVPQGTWHGKGSCRGLVTPKLPFWAAISQAEFDSVYGGDQEGFDREAIRLNVCEAWEAIDVTPKPGIPGPDSGSDHTYVWKPSERRRRL